MNGGKNSTPASLPERCAERDSTGAEAAPKVALLLRLERGAVVRLQQDRVEFVWQRVAIRNGVLLRRRGDFRAPKGGQMGGCGRPRGRRCAAGRIAFAKYITLTLAHCANEARGSFVW
jgi:hypothetical protein